MSAFNPHEERGLLEYGCGLTAVVGLRRQVLVAAFVIGSKL
jgi:hypothetical protein